MSHPGTPEIRTPDVGVATGSNNNELTIFASTIGAKVPLGKYKVPISCRSKPRAA